MIHRRAQALGLLATLVAATVLLPAVAHEGSVPWSEPRALDAGVYLELRHPRVLRRPGAFDIAALVGNLDGDGPVTVEELRYWLPGADTPVTVRPRKRLTSKRRAFRRYLWVRDRLRTISAGTDTATLRSLLDERRQALATIRSGGFVHRLEVPARRRERAAGEVSLAIEVDLLRDGRRQTLRRAARLPVQPPLPAGTDGAWFAGDQHLHTVFSIDAFFLDGTRELVDDYARSAELAGLDWIITTDHTNVDVFGWYKPWMFAVSEVLAAIHRQRTGFLVLQGQEMGVGAIGEFGESAHLLVYPRNADSTGFLPNPCRGLIANHVNCEPEQVVLDRVNHAGGIGFVAHPYSSTPLVYTEWDRDAEILGWAGLEIFNSSAGRLDDSDERSMLWWYDLLREIPAPSGGALPPRPGFPTRFPVGLGNSDAHQPADIGATFSFAYLKGIQPGQAPSREALMDALVNGRVVASNGPLVFGRINGAGPGEVASISPAGNELEVILQSTEEFGPAGDYELTVLVDGEPRLILPASGAAQFSASISLSNLLAPPDRFVTLRARRSVCNGCPADAVVREAISNPLWLDFQGAVPR
jgi:hypothetical protein